jgi:hypothetical protein
MTVLGRADAVMTATGPRQLEEATAGLLGAELSRAVREERGRLWLDWWFDELVDAAATRVRDELSGRSGGWEPPLRLLHGLASIGTPDLTVAAQSALDDVETYVADAAGGDPALAARPAWLPGLAQIAAVGDVWEMHDVYGARFGVIAGFSYPGGMDPSVFLFDIDGCAFVGLAGAGVYDDVTQAADAWRTFVGHAADAAQPAPVETSERLHCLTNWDFGEELLRGTESAAVMGEWFRAPRRLDDLATVLAERGTPLPETGSLYKDRDRDWAPMAKTFTDWYARRHGTEPDPEGLGVLAEEWVKGTLPGTEHAASPHRAKLHVTLINDWSPEHPVTRAATALLPEWVRWNGEHTGLPEHLIDHAVAVAAGEPLTDQDCPGSGLELR